MDLVSLLRIMARWWAVVVPLVLLTVVAAVLVGRVADPVYEASGSVLVAPPAFASPGTSFDGFNVDELAASIQQDDVLDELRVADELVDFTIDDATAGLMQVIATGASEAATEATADTVAALLVAELIAVQEEQEVGEASRIQPRLLTEQAVARQGMSGDGAQGFVANVAIVLEESAVEFQNPYSASPSTGRLLQVAVMSAEGQQRVSSLASESIAFEIYQDSQDRAPILEVATYGPSPQGALRGFEAVTETLSEVLDERQERAGVPPSQHVLIEVIAAPGGARDVSPPIERSVAVTIALGLLAAGAAALVSESLSNHRRQRKAAERSVADGPAQVLWPSSAAAQDTRAAQQPPDDLPRRFQSRP